MIVDLIAHVLGALAVGLFGDLFGLELVLILVCILIARRKRFPDRLFARVEACASEFTSGRPGLTVLLVGIVAVLLRLLLLPVIPVPHPSIADEFSNLLVADTLAQGRLANPTHSMWRSFESIHIIQHPTYSSMYFPLAGICLYFGQVVFGLPWAGLLLSMGAFCAAVCWMLQGWLPARWALLGAVLAVLKFALLSYWVESYWGGVYGALGGALVLGALPRLMKRPGWGLSCVLALGLVVLANSRPYEGVALAIPVAVRLAFWLFASGPYSFTAKLVRVVLPLAACLAVAAACMGVYFSRITGSPLVLPYAMNKQIYGWPLTLPWTSVDWVYQGHKQLREWYKYELSERLLYLSLPQMIGTTIFKAAMDWKFYIGAALTIPLLGIRFWFSDRRIRFLLLAVAVVVAMGGAITHFPHYLAPMTAGLFAIVIEGMRHLRHYERAGVPFGRRLTQLIPLVLVAVVCGRIAAAALHLPYQNSTGYTSWCCSMVGKVDRDSVVSMLPHDGFHLIVVRYKPWHPFLDEYVYNRADIDNSRVVWAREADDDQNRRLLEYFRNRKVWLLEPDISPMQLKPYEPGTYRRNPLEYDHFAGRE